MGKKGNSAMARNVYGQKRERGKGLGMHAHVGMGLFWAFLLGKQWSWILMAKEIWGSLVGHTL